MSADIPPGCGRDNPAGAAVSASRRLVAAAGAGVLLTGAAGCGSPVPSATGPDAAAAAVHSAASPGAEPASPVDPASGGLAAVSGASRGAARAAVRRVVVLGDSVTTGSTCDCTPFGQLVASSLARSQKRPVTYAGDGLDGLTADGLVDLLDAAHGDAQVRADVRRADLIILTIGANDLVGDDDSGGSPTGAGRGAATRAAQGVDRAMAAIASLAPHARLAVTNYWNAFTDGDDAVPDADERARTDALTRLFNAAVARIAARRGATLVDLYAPFKGDGSRDPGPLLLDDGDHPDAAGHRAIAGAVLRAIRSPLDPRGLRRSGLRRQLVVAAVDATRDCERDREAFGGARRTCRCRRLGCGAWIGPTSCGAGAPAT